MCIGPLKPPGTPGKPGFGPRPTKPGGGWKFCGPGPGEGGRNSNCKLNQDRGRSPDVQSPQIVKEERLLHCKALIANVVGVNKIEASRNHARGYKAWMADDVSLTEERRALRRRERKLPPYNRGMLHSALCSHARSKRETKKKSRRFNRRNRGNRGKHINKRLQKFQKRKNYRWGAGIGDVPDVLGAETGDGLAGT